jgi:hypothetical protein
MSMTTLNSIAVKPSSSARPVEKHSSAIIFRRRLEEVRQRKIQEEYARRESIRKRTIQTDNVDFETP